jgi:putative colanic acid biosynthesis acetyltransferase WcaB
MQLQEWVRQDWPANAGRPESQLLLAWFRLAQWAARRWGPFSRAIVTPYWLTSSLLLGIELPVTATVGPRLRLHHRNGIVVNPQCVIGRDCHLRHGVTIGNKVDRAGRDLGVPTIGDGVDLGAGCAVIGDVRVGDHARIGALAVVTESVPAWGVVVGNPGHVIRVDPPAPCEPDTAPLDAGVPGPRRGHRTRTR